MRRVVPPHLREAAEQIAQQLEAECDRRAGENHFDPEEFRAAVIATLIYREFAREPLTP